MSRQLFALNYKLVSRNCTSDHILIYISEPGIAKRKKRGNFSPPTQTKKQQNTHFILFLVLICYNWIYSTLSILEAALKHSTSLIFRWSDRNQQVLSLFT